MGGFLIPISPDVEGSCHPLARPSAVGHKKALENDPNHTKACVLGSVQNINDRYRDERQYSTQFICS